MLHGFHNLKYHEKLSQLGLTTLKNRRLRGDLIETYKLLTNKEDIDSQQFFQLTEDPYQLRGNNRRIYNVRSRGEIRRNLFSQRVIDHWNNLPQEIITADCQHFQVKTRHVLEANNRYGTISHRFSPIIIKFKLYKKRATKLVVAWRTWVTVNDSASWTLLPGEAKVTWWTDRDVQDIDWQKC